MQLTNPHPLFIEQSKHLHLAVGDRQALHRYQQFMLRREPENLRRHVQHIFNLLEQEALSRDVLFGALLDLFIILGRNGLALRKRMLALSSEYITEQDIQFFLRYMACGINAATVVSNPGFSVLTQGYNGRNDVLTRAEIERASHSMSAYEEALVFIEQGELDLACELLEKTLQESPEDQQIADELLAIYRHQNDEQGLEIMRSWFIENDLSLPINWPLF